MIMLIIESINSVEFNPKLNREPSVKIQGLLTNIFLNIIFISCIEFALKNIHAKFTSKKVTNI